MVGLAPALPETFANSITRKGLAVASDIKDQRTGPVSTWGIGRVSGRPTWVTRGWALESAPPRLPGPDVYSPDVGSLFRRHAPPSGIQGAGYGAEVVDYWRTTGKVG
jgi:hypothetical protein